MSLNRTVSDLKIKSIRVKRRSGNSWIRPPESSFIHGDQYRLEVIFGNTGGMIHWDNERYRKDNVNIRIVAKGFKSGASYKYKTKIVFYTNSSFANEVSGARYRTAFDIAIYETHHADCLFFAYFKVLPNTRRYTITSFKWDTGIYASVRNRVWRSVRTVV